MLSRGALVLIILCALAWLVLSPKSMAEFVTTIFTSVGVFFKNLA